MQLPCLISEISVIDIASSTILTVIEITNSDPASCIAITPDGTTAYVGLADIVSVIDLQSYSVVATISSVAVWDIVITPNGRYAYVANGGDLVWVIEVSSNTIYATITVTSGGALLSIGITPDGKYVYAVDAGNNEVFVINTSTNTVVTGTGYPIAVGSNPLAYGTFIQPAAGENMAGYVNKLRNGTFDIWQRGTASVSVPTTGAYVPDGWIVVPTGASCIALQASDNRSGSLALYGLKIVGANSVTDILVKQRIESYLSAAIAGQICTFQAWVYYYNSGGGSITPQISTKYAGSTDNWTSPTTDLSATNVQACPSGSWTQIAYALSTSSSAANGYEVDIDFGNHFGSTSDYVIIAEADFRVAGAVTGLIPNPPTPELRSVAAELAECQRYFYEISSASPANPYTTFGVGGTASSTIAYIDVDFAQTMRGIPSFTSSAYSTFQDNNASITSITALNTSAFGYNSAALYFTGTASGAGKSVMIGAAGTASAYMQFSAEL